MTGLKLEGQGRSFKLCTKSTLKLEIGLYLSGCHFNKKQLKGAKSSLLEKYWDQFKLVRQHFLFSEWCYHRDENDDYFEKNESINCDANTFWKMKSGAVPY